MDQVEPYMSSVLIYQIRQVSQLHLKNWSVKYWQVPYWWSGV